MSLNEYLSILERILMFLPPIQSNSLTGTAIRIPWPRFFILGFCLCHLKFIEYLAFEIRI
jgi:hypothetical protein